MPMTAKAPMAIASQRLRCLRSAEVWGVRSCSLMMLSSVSTVALGQYRNRRETAGQTAVHDAHDSVAGAVRAGRTRRDGLLDQHDLDAGDDQYQQRQRKHAREQP